MGRRRLRSRAPAPAPRYVYLVEEASTNNSICTPGNDGVFFSSSDNGGAQWDTSLPVTTGAARTETIEPAIAADRNTPGRVYIAYSRLTFADANCTGSPLDSEIYLIYSTNGGGSWSAPRRVSPISPSGTDHYRDPSLAVLPDGRVIVAFRNEPSAQVETETCTLPAGPARDQLLRCADVGPRGREHRRRQRRRQRVCRRRASWPPEGA